MSSIRTIDPRDMNVMEWTAAMALNLGQFGYIPQLLDRNRWQDWGASLLVLASLSGIIIPLPYDFTDWRDWAARTNEVLDNAG